MEELLDPPPIFDILYPICITVIFLATTIVFIILVWAIIFRSPEEMQVYKWFLLAYVTNVFIVEVLLALLQPTFFLHKYFFTILGGITQLLPIDIREIGCHSLCLAFWLTLQCIYQIDILFLYRVAQTTQNEFLLKTLGNYKYVVPAFIIVFFAFFFGIIWPFHQLRLPVSEVEEYIHNNFTIISSKYPDRKITAIDGIPLVTALSSFIFGLISISIFSFSTYKMYKTLKSIKSMVTPKTYNMFRNLVQALLLDLLIYFTMFTLIDILAVLYLVYPKYILTTAMLTFIVMCLWPLGTELILLLYLGPYRRALYDLIKRITKNNNDVQLIKISVVSTSGMPNKIHALKISSRN